MIYLTYNDAPGGIYKSQVIDVCRFLEGTYHERVTLIAFISARGFFANRRKIKKGYPYSMVLPMYPRIENWKKNIGILRIVLPFLKKENVIARGVFATLIARDSMKFAKVCFDARGAYMAEWEEYLASHSPALTNEMRILESRALLESDSRIAVSQKLVDYWKTQFNYQFLNHVVIPCTLSSDLEINYSAEKVSTTRKELGINDNDIVLTYSGSSAGWQSFKVLEETITKAFTQNPSLKLLMLCSPETAKPLQDKFPGRVIQKWVNEKDVQNYLRAADYGLLVREDSVTNQVSSPVKFGEYLAAGLKVIISNNIGDFSQFVQDKNCGMLADIVNWTNLQRPSAEEKKNIQLVAETFFRKKNYTEQYKKLF